MLDCASLNPTYACFTGFTGFTGFAGMLYSMASMAEKVLVTSSVAVMEELTECALTGGKFNLRSVLAAAASAAAGVEIGSQVPGGILASEISNGISNGITSAITGQSISFDALAGQSLGIASSQSSTAYADKKIEQARYESALKALDRMGPLNHEAAASPSASATGENMQSARETRLHRYAQQASQTNQQSGSKWEPMASMMDEVKAMENQMLANSLKTTQPVVGNDTRSSVNVSNTSANNYEMPTNASSHTNGLGNAILGAYTSVADWSGATLDKIGFWAKDMSNTYLADANQALARSEQFLQRTVIDDMAAETGGDVNYGLSQLAKGQANSYLSYGTKVNALKWLGTAGLGAEFVEGGEKVLHTYLKGGDWKLTAVDETAKIGGGYIGSRLGFAATALVAPETGFTSFLLAPAVAVGTGTLVGYMAEEVADTTYKYLFK